MTSAQDDTETTTPPTIDAAKALTPLEIPQEPAPPVEAVSDDALQFDEPSSALASRVLSAHDNPSPPPSPLLQADLPIFSEQRSVSPIRPMMLTENLADESEGNRDDVLDMEEVENSLVLEQRPESEPPMTDASSLSEQTDQSGSEKENSLPPTDGTPVVEPVAEPIQTMPLVATLAPVLPQDPQEIATIPPAEKIQESEEAQPSLDTPSKTPRRSTRPRRSLVPFGLTTSSPLSTPPSSSKPKGGKGKEKATAIEGTPPALPELPQKEASEEKKRRRKERSRASQETADQLRSLSPGSSALLTQLVSAPGVENSNPFEEPPQTPPTNASSITPEFDGPPNSLSVEPTSEKDGDTAVSDSPKRLPIRPTRTINEEVRQSPSPRRVPLNRATPGVRKVMQSQTTAPTPAKGLFASHVSLPALNHSSHKSPSRVTSSSPLRSPSKPSAPHSVLGSVKKPVQESIEPQPRPSTVPEGPNAPSLPFPITSSKPPTSNQRSRVPVSSNVVRQPPSRIPRIGNKPYARSAKADTSKIPTRLPSPTKKISQQGTTDTPATPIPSEGSTISETERVLQSPFKRKREAQVPESHIPKRKKLSPEDETLELDSVVNHDDNDLLKTRTPSPNPVEVPIPSSPVQPVPVETDESLEAHLPPIEVLHLSPSPPPRRTARSRKVVPLPTVLSSLNQPPRRKPPAVRNEPETFAGMTITAFRQLTTVNTTKNQEYLATTLETEIVRIEGARPESPTTKVRTALQKSKEEADMQRSARAQRRARRSGEGLSEEEDERPSTPASHSKHARGPGDEDDYTTPERNSKRIKVVDDSGTAVEVEERRVKWDRGLSTVTYLDEVHPNGKAHSDFAIKKGCFTNKSKALINQLDALGNIPNLDTPLDDLIPQNVVVKKFVYDDEVPPPILAPAPAPAKATRSKSKAK